MSPDELQTASARVDAILHSPHLFAARPLTGEFEGVEMDAKTFVVRSEDGSDTPFGPSPAEVTLSSAPQAAASAPPKERAKPVKGKCKWCDKAYSRHKMYGGDAHCLDAKGYAREFEVAADSAPPAESAPVQAAVLTEEQVDRIRDAFARVQTAQLEMDTAIDIAQAKEENRDNMQNDLDDLLDSLTRPAPQTAEVK